MTRVNLDIFLYRLNRLLIDQGHECDATLTSARPTVYTFEADCRRCDLKLNLEAEPIDNLYSQVSQAPECSSPADKTKDA